MMNELSHVRRVLSSVVGMVFLFISGSLSAAQQVPPKEVNERQPLTANQQLEDVRIRGESVARLLAQLSIWYDVPIGLEVVMNSPSLSTLRMNFKRATIQEVLTQFVAEHPEYAWEIREGVVNVFPKEGRRDPILQQILSTEIRMFSTKENSVTWDVENALLATPELKPLMDAYALNTLGFAFSGFYFPVIGRKYKLDVSNMTVQSILNKLVRESPTARFWSIYRDSTEHVLSISISARHEDLPKGLKPVDFDELERSFDLMPLDPPNR